MAPDLIFEEPPAGKTGRPVGSSPFGRWLNELRNYPGKWAKYPEQRDPSKATVVRHGRAYGVEAGEFEVRTINAGTRGKAWIYARYIGGES